MTYALDESTEKKCECNNNNSEQYFILHYYFVFHFNSLHLFIIRILKCVFFLNILWTHRQRWRITCNNYISDGRDNEWRRKQQQQRHRHENNAGSRQKVWIKNCTQQQQHQLNCKYRNNKTFAIAWNFFLWISRFYDRLCISKLLSVATKREEAKNMYTYTVINLWSLSFCQIIRVKFHIEQQRGVVVVGFFAHIFVNTFRGDVWATDEYHIIRIQSFAHIGNGLQSYTATKITHSCETTLSTIFHISFWWYND